QQRLRQPRTRLAEIAGRECDDTEVVEVEAGATPVADLSKDGQRLMVQAASFVGIAEHQRRRALVVERVALAPAIPGSNEVSNALAQQGARLLVVLTLVGEHRLEIERQSKIERIVQRLKDLDTGVDRSLAG